MTYPIPETKSCKSIGQTEATWQAGREFPVNGEDFGYLIWRKRDCCLL
ncbi:traU family protein [Orientia tsutsugamushi str. UT144]|nr:traU family protein [Orientia tsutsugamushi str. UT144]